MKNKFGINSRFTENTVSKPAESKLTKYRKLSKSPVIQLVITLRFLEVSTASCLYKVCDVPWQEFARDLSMFCICQCNQSCMF